MSEQDYRLPAGGRIDRSRTLSFTFNSRRYQGYAGDTLASALLANGVRMLARSFKYHRPRGLLGAGVEEPNAFVQLGSGARQTPNALATQIELYPDLAAYSQNCWPAVGFDLGAWTNTIAALLPAGFYYKTFMWPAQLWRVYEHLIRRAAGEGQAPTRPDPDRYEHRWEQVDIAVIGGGPAGLAAALTAARSGARVLLADESSEFGGRLLSEQTEIDGRPALDWVAATLAELATFPDIIRLPRTTAFGYHDHQFLTLLERVCEHLGPHAPPRLPRQRLWQVRAQQVILATGALERPLVFPDNDRPGVMLASAAQTYLNRYAVRPGTTVVIVTNNDSAYPTALELAAQGVTVAAIADLRPEPGGWAERAEAEGLTVLPAHAVTAVQGYRRVRGVTVTPLHDSGQRLGGERRVVACDTLLCAGGWNPTVHLYSQAGGKLRYDETLACLRPDTARPGLSVVGAANGVFDLASCLAEGFAAGQSAARLCGLRAANRTIPSATPTPDPTPYPLWQTPAGQRDKCFVDLHNDVTANDLRLAVREGYVSVEHLKRYTTAGMGIDQGKTGNVNALALLAAARGEPITAVGTTTFRPPYTPVAFGAVAGRQVGELYAPVRKTPLTDWHAAHGAVFEPTGLWRRPLVYPHPGEQHAAAVRRECLAVRQGVALLDSSTLGKIDLQGRDVLTLLNRVYSNAWDSLAIGRCRYGLMLGEDGMPFDDGVTARLGENHYLLMTTSGGAARVYGWLEAWLQGEWPDLDVCMTSVTTHWASLALIGPKAREVLAALGTDIDLTPAAFPHLSVRSGKVMGIPARVLRVSFTGEVSYEINVPAGYATTVWEALMTAGHALAITPLGLEALDILRAEKGYLLIGKDTDGAVTPHDLGMSGLVSKRKDFFIGQRSLARSDALRRDRRQLVGLLSDDPQAVIPEGAYIVAEVTSRPPMPLIGHVTSTCFSPTLNRSIALALLKNGHARLGERVAIPLPDKVMVARITEPRFYDPEGIRLHA